MLKILSWVVTAGIAALLLSSSSLVAQTTGVVTGRSVQTNPDTSLSVLTLYNQSRRLGAGKTDTGGGLSLQEAELQFMADVDPYLRAGAMFSVHPADKTPAAATNPPTPAPATKYEIEPEEVYLETISLPSVTVRAGRFHAALGRHNLLHTHAFPFVDQPLIATRLLGDDGLTEVGVSAAVLLPAPWFSELTLQAFQGESPKLFGATNTSALASIYRWRNMFDLTGSMSLDLGLSAASGPNFYNDRTSVQGFDLTIRWRPLLGGKYTSVIFGNEYLKGDVRGRPDESTLEGFSSWLKVQVAERWWLGGRGEQAGGTSDPDHKLQDKYSGIIEFLPSEFSGIRLQYSRLYDNSPRPQENLALQTNIVIGVHPAHSF